MHAAIRFIQSKKTRHIMNFENFDPYFPDQPVVDLYLPVWANLPAFSSKPAFIWPADGAGDSLSGASSITYRQLNDAVQLISERLLARLRRRDTVLILCSPGLELVQLIYGCHRAGLLTVPISPSDPRFSGEAHHHFARALSETKPRAAIADGAYVARVLQYISSGAGDEKLSGLLQRVEWISIDDLTKSNIFQIPKFCYSSYGGCQPEEAFLVQYTSGAAGDRKPVVISAGAAAHNVRAARKAYDLHPNSVIVSWLPQYHDCGFMFLLLTVVSGATCVITSPGRFVQKPLIWLHLVSQYRATCTPVPAFALPLVLRRLKDGKPTPAGGMDLGSLKNLILINEPVRREPVEEFLGAFRRFGLNPACVSPSYGLAENCTFVSTSWRRTGVFTDMPTYGKLLPSGRLGVCGEEEEGEMDILVVDERTREPVNDGVEGEIWISSPSNASGYLNHPSLTKEVFHNSLSKKSSSYYIRSGDRGVVKGEERYLFVTGRCSDVIELPNKRGIHPHYLETAAYNSCPNFLRGGCAAVVKISEAVAIVAEMQNGDEGEEVHRKICEGMRRAAATEEGVEVGVVILVGKGSIPKTTSGKLKRWAAKEKLICGKMSVVMGVRFGREEEEEGCLKPLKMGNDEEGENLVSSSQIHPFLLSLL